MARLRYNGLTATLGADLLTAGTTITFTAALSSAAGAVPTISGSDYIPLAVLDTDGAVLEIVHLTAYTSGATTGTVTRAQESTTAADHATGLTVLHGPTAADLAAGSVSYAGSTNLAATDVEAALDELDAEKAPAAAIGCTAWRSTSQSIATATTTAILFDSETFDTHGFHSTSTNTSRITIPAGMGGVYTLMAQVRYVANGTGVRTAAIRKNGTTELANTPINNNGASVATGVVTLTAAQLVAGDYIELLAWQNSGVSLNTDASGSLVWTFLSAIRNGS